MNLKASGVSFTSTAVDAMAWLSFTNLEVGASKSVLNSSGICDSRKRELSSGSFENGVSAIPLNVSAHESVLVSERAVSGRSQ
ncbi:hypothetical protein CLOP_g19472 [Closterium sp. NIES-67]|nr:hypothetical protein CLOP_g19472 [Closterium sp. NIES-67]